MYCNLEMLLILFRSEIIMINTPETLLNYKLFLRDVYGHVTKSTLFEKVSLSLLGFSLFHKPYSVQVI